MGHRGLFEAASVLLGIHPEGKRIAGSCGSAVFNFEGTTILFSRAAIPFAFPAMGSSFSMSLPTFIFCFVLMVAILMGLVVSHCGFDSVS